MGINYPAIELPDKFLIDDTMIEKPLTGNQAGKATVLRGPTIVVPEAPLPLPKDLNAKVLLKCGDKITTDHIMPAGVFLKYRSNVPQYAKVVFNCFNEEAQPTFAQCALDLKAAGIGSVIVAGTSYGQGSSREHAALCPMYLGVRAVIAKSIERIHKANLINFAIVPITFADENDYDKINIDNDIEISNLLQAIEKSDSLTITDKTNGFDFTGLLELSKRDREILLSAGLLNYTRGKSIS